LTRCNVSSPLKPPPIVSRKPLVLAIAVCLLLSGVIIPVGAHLPKWIEAEIVIAAWWLIWILTLTALLYQGHRVDDDSQIEFGGDKTRMVFEACNLADLGGCLFGESCASIFLGLLAALLIGLAFVVLIEFIVPAIAILLLLSIGGMLARAVNDSHHCSGRLGLSLLWATLWSTLYIGPVFVIVLALSALLTKRS
jgi:hypothetical protein